MFAERVQPGAQQHSTAKLLRDKPAVNGQTPLSTIFHEPWWLDIACDGDYREAIVVIDGKTVGRLPYRRRSQFPGLNTLGMPNLVHVLGPGFAVPSAHSELRPLKQLQITRELIEQLPRAIHTSFRLHAGISDTLAFGEAGFETKVDFTVEIPPAPAETIWRQMRDKTRNVIRRARETHIVDETMDAERFLSFYENNLGQRGMRNVYQSRLALPLIAGAIERGVGRILRARDHQGAEKGAVFIVWDHRAAYYFMSTRTTDAMNGVINLLIWNAIQDAMSKNLIFDMDQLHVKRHSLPNHLLLTGFGGVVKPRFTVSRTAPAARIMREVYGVFQR
jgi:hypothetical protein